MSNREHVYKTSDSRVLAAWEAAERESDAYVERRREALAEWGFERDIALYGSNSPIAGRRFEGIAWGADELPAGWRRDRAAPGMIVPVRRSAAGKKIAAQFDKLRSVPDGRRAFEQFGMPSIVMRAEAGRMFASTYGVARVGDCVWVWWGVDPNPRDGDRGSGSAVDMGVWERVPLSQYYALVEAGQDPFAAKTNAGMSA